MDLTDHKRAFNSVGWFIPPYLQMGYLHELKAKIDAGTISDQRTLQMALAPAFTPEPLAAMVCERYSITPYVSDYKDIIAEAVEAHFTRLGHIAVAGLTPVIEGVGKKLADRRGIRSGSIRYVFAKLAADVTEEVVRKNIGLVEEIVSMLASFKEFIEKYLYAASSIYPLSDKTNRHGILHGAYTDAEYGEAINFYKVMGALDFLCFVSALITKPISAFAPNNTARSLQLAAYYRVCMSVSASRPPAVP